MSEAAEPFDAGCVALDEGRWTEAGRWSSAACMAARQRRYREAEMLFRQGLAHDHDGAVVCRDYGLFLQRRGRLATARPYLQRAVARSG